MNISARTRYAVYQLSSIINRRYSSGAMPIIAVVDTFISTMLTVMLLRYLGVTMAWHEVLTMVVLADVVVLALIGLAVNSRHAVVGVVTYSQPCTCGCNDDGYDDDEDNDDNEDDDDVETDDDEADTATEPASGSESMYEKPEDAEINSGKKD